MANAQDPLAAVRERIADGAVVAVLSGAGISAASGIPTFRGARDSLWSNYRPEELATPDAFAADLFLIIGTAGAVYPAAGLAETAHDAGAFIIEFNLQPSGISHLANLFVPGSAADTMPRLLA